MSFRQNSSLLILALSLVVSPLAVAQKPTPAPLSAEPTRHAVAVVSVREHDPGAFTQGLFLHDGKLYEGTGMERQSSLRRVDPATGIVEAQVSLPADEFGEGITLANGKIFQLTWKNGIAHVYDVATLKKTGDFKYSGEGWGLTFDGTHLIMSNGSDKLSFRDPATFKETSTIRVTAAGKPVMSLNELEYVDGFVYANIWRQEIIAKIDPATGAVRGVIDARGLLSPEERQGTDVMNGIAYDEATGNFLITGKYWPKLFEVQFTASR